MESNNQEIQRSLSNLLSLVEKLVSPQESSARVARTGVPTHTVTKEDDAHPRWLSLPGYPASTSCSSARCKNRSQPPFTCARAHIGELFRNFISIQNRNAPAEKRTKKMFGDLSQQTFDLLNKAQFSSLNKTTISQATISGVAGDSNAFDLRRPAFSFIRSSRRCATAFLDSSATVAIWPRAGRRSPASTHLVSNLALLRAVARRK